MKARITMAAQPHRRRFLVRTLGLAVGAGLVWAGLGAGLPDGTHPKGSTTTTAADTAPGYAVEDFAYPRADEILAEQGILLKRGDGHIVLTPCDSQEDLLEIYVRMDNTEKFCFRTTGTSGYLSLDLPAVYGAQTNDYAAELSTTVGGEEHRYHVDADSFAALGEANEGRHASLVEIITSR
ncbi:hypothetical protein [Streptomyces sp. TS71-3]|uniref:hypothetical protein n=1 Tax=Streptomyces sp. TS71-3 TaxID=2733862 RepID=UPI001B0EE414|nr:hypothetical protein [Streptomyces sp. TS71-3]GHJ41166.1 hypothetical protein Sm713_67750 [Streptomyces sp. TS71-3]